MPAPPQRHRLVVADACHCRGRLSLTVGQPQRRHGDDDAEDIARAGCSVMEPQVWHNLIVRLWRDSDGLKIRFLVSQTGRPATSTLTLATSIESATRQFEQWLRSIDPGDDDG